MGVDLVIGRKEMSFSLLLLVRPFEKGRSNWELC
jgi:hypothetical protein